MEYRGPTKTVRISEILDESGYGFKVQLEFSGMEVWINHDHIVDTAPKVLIVKEWFYKKEIAQHEDIKSTEVPF